MRTINPGNSRMNRTSGCLGGICLVVFLLSGCLADFTESVPCESNLQCPSDFGCVGGTCVDGAAGDALPDAGDTDVPDTDDDVSLDTGGSDVEPGDTTAEDSGATDTAADTPDGDGGITGPCPEHMAHVADASIGAYCIDLYEASRSDATAENAGSADSEGARSTRGVLPWTDLSSTAAKGACQTAGKRLCSVDEWEIGCGGAQRQVYPYGDTYDREICNASGSLGATAQLTGCAHSAVGTFDMSGNVAEYVDIGPTSISVKGGSYTDFTDVEFQCTGEGRNLSPRVTVGFRCCADPN